LLAENETELTDEIDGQPPIRDASGGVAEEGHPVRRVDYQQIGRRRPADDHEVAGVSEGVAEAKNGGVVDLD
jgi:hypothetical protein